MGLKVLSVCKVTNLSMFTILDEEGMEVKTVPLEDMSDDGDGEIMSDVYLMEAFEEVGDKVAVSVWSNRLMGIFL